MEGAVAAIVINQGKGTTVVYSVCEYYIELICCAY